MVDRMAMEYALFQALLTNGEDQFGIVIAFEDVHDDMEELLPCITRKDRRPVPTCADVGPDEPLIQDADMYLYDGFPMTSVCCHEDYVILPKDTTMFGMLELHEYYKAHRTIGTLGWCKKRCSCGK